MKLKRLLILSVNYHHHENRILQDDPLIVDTVGDNLDLSTCNICQILLNFFYETRYSNSQNGDSLTHVDRTGF